jgi:hypothetical protein
VLEGEDEEEEEREGGAGGADDKVGERDMVKIEGNTLSFDGLLKLKSKGDSHISHCHLSFLLLLLHHHRKLRLFFSTFFKILIFYRPGMGGKKRGKEREVRGTWRGTERRGSRRSRSRRSRRSGG